MSLQEIGVPDEASHQLFEQLRLLAQEGASPEPAPPVGDRDSLELPAPARCVGAGVWLAARSIRVAGRIELRSLPMPGL